MLAGRAVVVAGAGLPFTWAGIGPFDGEAFKQTYIFKKKKKKNGEEAQLEKSFILYIT